MNYTKNKSYHEQLAIDNTVKLRELLSELPKFLGDFFRGIEPTTSARTRLGYAYDLRIFFRFILEYKEYAIPCNTTKDSSASPNLSSNMSEIPLSVLNDIAPEDIEEYMQYLKYYQNGTKEYTNDERGISRKLSSLRTMYHYFYKKQRISQDPTTIVDAPKLHDKNIIRLEVDEVSRLLDEVESGDNLTEKQKEYHKKTKIRDLALLTLLLGTGMRVSECVGIDISDIDFETNGIRVIRKGGKEVILYFGDEVCDALLQYLGERKKINAASGHENALFLSMQKKRISVRSVEKLVKKYAQLVTTMKKITPHKLRSTFGTTLYQETGDIYLVADVLGHSDVNTTKRHYAAIDEQRRRSAKNIVKLREP